MFVAIKEIVHILCLVLVSISALLTGVNEAFVGKLKFSKVVRYVRRKKERQSY